MKFSSVLFDLDGTILHTADDLGGALNRVCEKHGKTAVSSQRYIQEASNGSKGLLKLAFGADFIGYDFEVLKAEFLQYYSDNIAVHTDFFAGVQETLSGLNEKGIPWGIVTNKPAFLTVPLLSYYPEFAHCRTVVSGDTLKVAKPSPEPLLYGLNELAMPVSGCLYVGDALRDIEAGQNAGMKTAAALYGYIAQDDNVDGWGADYCFESLLELIELV